MPPHHKNVYSSSPGRQKKPFFFTWKQFRSTVARKIFTNALGCLCIICSTCKLILIGSKHLDNRDNSEALLLGKMFANALECLCIICRACKLVLIGSKHLDNACNKKNYRLTWCDKFEVIMKNWRSLDLLEKMWLGRGITEFCVWISFTANGND